MKIEVKLYLKREKQDAVLYITDDLKEVRRLLSEGKAAAALLTLDNCEEDFSGILYALERIEELEIEDFERIYRRIRNLPLEILETDRCIVREMTEEDVEALYEIYAEKGITKYIEELFEDPEEERRYITDYRKYIYGYYEYGMWIIEEKGSGKVIGRAGIDPRDGENELGYVIAAPSQKKGYAYEVCSAIIDYIWKIYKNPESVISRVDPQNIASVKLLKKLGFEKLGTEGEMDVYRIKKALRRQCLAEQ